MNCQLPESKLPFGDSGEFHEMALESSLERIVPVDGNGDADL
jgi:hypothetical protein